MNTTIKDVPMLTSDEKEIELNSILFTADWDSGYNFNSKGKTKIKAHRVISIDNTRRFFRTRCIDGCETEHKFSEGCKRQDKLWGAVKSAKEEALKLIQHDFLKCTKKLEDVESTRKHLKGQLSVLAAISESDIKIPKAIKETK